MRKAITSTCLLMLTAVFATSLRAIPQQTQIELTPLRHLRKGVEAWPLILNPKSDVERRINGYLVELNDRLVHSLKECDAASAPMEKWRSSKGDRDEEDAESWNQAVEVTMNGPTFLSLVASTGFYCGGAHPYEYTDVAVFNLQTGEPADSVEWFDPSSKASVVTDENEDSSLEKSVFEPQLLSFYRESTRHECDDTYPDDQSFLIWPDAKSGKVMVQADRLPGCCEACGIAIGLNLEQARKVGFAKPFLQSIEDGHQAIANRR